MPLSDAEEAMFSALTNPLAKSKRKNQVIGIIVFVVGLALLVLSLNTHPFVGGVGFVLMLQGVLRYLQLNFKGDPLPTASSPTLNQKESNV